MARLYAPVPGWLPFEKGSDGKTKNYVSEETGEVISRRQYDKLKRPGFTNESLSKFNEQTEPVKHAKRSARGKSGLNHLPAEEAEREANRRIAESKKKKEEEAAQREAAKIHKKIESAKSKKRAPPKRITGALLTPGALGRRIEYDSTYPEYLRLFDEAKKSRKIFGYSIGLIGVHEVTGSNLTAVIFPLRGFDNPISRKSYNKAIKDFLMSHSYFILVGAFMHLAFLRKYAEEKLKKYGDQRKHKPGRKRK